MRRPMITARRASTSARAKTKRPTHAPASSPRAALQSGFLGRVRHAPALRIHGVAGEQLAGTAAGGAAGVELAIGAVVAWLVLRAGRLGVVFHIVQSFCGRIRSEEH